jgi:hypothetical protein
MTSATWRSDALDRKWSPLLLRGCERDAEPD